MPLGLAKGTTKSTEPDEPVSVGLRCVHGTATGSDLLEFSGEEVGVRRDFAEAQIHVTSGACASQPLLGIRYSFATGDWKC